MITDERTRNRLYADTETTLFTLEDKPGAILRIMEIIRDTPEYVQLSPLLPAYAEENRQAEWWKGKEPDFLLAELLHVLQLYAPEGFILGPITGRTHAFGYTNPEYEKNLIYRTEIELDWGYVYGKKNEYRKKRKLYEEIAEIFTTDGYTTEMEKRGKGCRITRGNTRLYSHYEWITGQCEATHLTGTVTGFNRHTSKRYATDISKSAFPEASRSVMKAGTVSAITSMKGYGLIRRESP